MKSVILATLCVCLVMIGMVNAASVMRKKVDSGSQDDGVCDHCVSENDVLTAMKLEFASLIGKCEIFDHFNSRKRESHDEFKENTAFRSYYLLVKVCPRVKDFAVHNLDGDSVADFTVMEDYYGLMQCVNLYVNKAATYVVESLSGEPLEWEGAIDFSKELIKSCEKNYGGEEEEKEKLDDALDKAGEQSPKSVERRLVNLLLNKLTSKKQTFHKERGLRSATDDAGQEGVKNKCDFCFTDAVVDHSIKLEFASLIATCELAMPFANPEDANEAALLDFCGAVKKFTENPEAEDYPPHIFDYHLLQCVDLLVGRGAVEEIGATVWDSAEKFTSATRDSCIDKYGPDKDEVDEVKNEMENADEQSQQSIKRQLISLLKQMTSINQK